MNAPRRIEDLEGVGPAVAAKFKALGIADETGLLLHRPLRYEDRTRITPINRIRPSTTALVQGIVAHQEVRQGRRRSLLVLLEDDHGQLVLRFFNFYPSQRRQFTPAAVRPDGLSSGEREWVCAWSCKGPVMRPPSASVRPHRGGSTGKGRRTSRPEPAQRR